jgi:hypothetical protein
MKQLYSSRKKTKSGITSIFLQVTEDMYVADAQKALKQAKSITNVRPDAIVTDEMDYKHTKKP